MWGETEMRAGLALHFLLCRLAQSRTERGQALARNVPAELECQAAANLLKLANLTAESNRCILAI
jgi:hypothetical protein